MSDAKKPKHPPTTRGRPKVRKDKPGEWGVFFPMWNKRYAETLLKSFQRGNGMPHSMRPIAELRKLPAPTKARGGK